ncbi:hypothetical protein Gohar_009197 [Gossypium harknessii]|uniref:DUF7745 domain-containing protein n=2 Tax=Gossypium harknessii TaxID=34285 RepID=A0A7J9GM22_9ROSI|nr:hypothetical protein [Gossypium harknessii]
MEKRFFDKVEDNTAIRIWSEKTQQEKGNSLTEGYVSKLWDFTRISVTQNNLQELKELFRALVQYWNPAYSCFTFGKVDLVPTIEEYTTLLCCPRIQADKAYSRATNVSNFLKRLMSITGITHPDTKKRVDVFALSIYGLVIFPKALGHIDEAVSDLFDRLDKRVMPVLAILVETFRSLSACQRASEGRFIGLRLGPSTWDMESYWICPLLVLRQYRLRQFISATQGLAQCEFAYNGDNYKKKVHEISNTWNQTYKMKRFVRNPMTTLEYDWWWGKRVNDNVPLSNQENTRPIEEHLQVIPSELEIIKQDFEKRSSELEKKIK